MSLEERTRPVHDRCTARINGKRCETPLTDDNRHCDSHTCPWCNVCLERKRKMDAEAPQ